MLDADTLYDNVLVPMTAQYAEPYAPDQYSTMSRREYKELTGEQPHNDDEYFELQVNESFDYCASCGYINKGTRELNDDERGDPICDECQLPF